MEKIDIVITIVVGGFGLIFSLILIVWNSLTQRIEKLDEKITDIDRRACRLEGAFASKDCCMIKDERITKKVAE